MKDEINSLTEFKEFPEAQVFNIKDLGFILSIFSWLYYNLIVGERLLHAVLSKDLFLLILAHILLWNTDHCIMLETYQTTKIYDQFLTIN